VAKKSKSTDTVETKAVTTAPEGPSRLCPACGIKVMGHRCTQCRATVEIQPVNGMLIWMRNGRVVRAFRSEHKAYVEVATEMGIPSSEWDEAYRPKPKSK